MNSPLLEKISQPSDLKKLSSQQTVQLCAEIREFLLDNVSKTGGHLASNLGAVELTVALHRVLTTPTDEIVFDVGHQCYTHKLLTGRRAGFAGSGAAGFGCAAGCCITSGAGCAAGMTSGWDCTAGRGSGCVSGCC